MAQQSMTCVNQPMKYLRDAGQRERKAQASDGATVQSSVFGSDVLSDGFLQLDEDLRITHANDAAAEALAIGSQSPLGLSLRDLPASRHLKLVLDTICQVSTSRVPRGAKVSVPTTGRNWQIKVFPACPGFALFFRDVTTEQKARGWLSLLNMAVDRINDLVMVTDGTPLTREHGPRVIYVNTTFETVTGFSRDEIIGTCPIFLRDGGVHVPGAGPIVEAVAQGKEVRGEVQCHTRHGQELWLEIDMVPLFDAEGQLTNWVSLKRNITERRQLEKHLRESEGFRGIARMSGKIAHDFNNLLSIVMGNCDAIVDMTEPGSVLRDLAERCLRAGERGAKLTARLQAFGGTQQLFPEPCNLGDVAASLVEGFRTELSPQIGLDIDASPGLWLTRLDRQRFSSSIHELLCNARDAISDAGNITVTVRNVRLDGRTDKSVHDLPPGAYVELSITDTGRGMTREQIDSAVRPFFSTRQDGLATGLGLGGALGFARQSGGHMQLDSVLGQGTTVSFLFPAEEIPSSAPTRHHAAPRKVEAASAQNLPPDLRILLVEDDPQVRQDLVRNLEQRGLSVMAAANATEALRILAQRNPPDMMISDIVMPGDMDGIALAQIARRYVPEMKVLLISGFADRQVAAGVAEDPGIGFMPKPFRLDGLLARMSELHGP